MKDFIAQQNEATLASYRARRENIREHEGIEQGVLAGGYGYRQILELVQNGADAILEANEVNAAPHARNQIEVKLCSSYLYVANTGAPLSQDGLVALLTSHSSPKRGNQIGRFGLGFKSLLRLKGTIDIFTKASGAVRFDPQRCQDTIRNEFGVSEAPGLRLAWPVDEHEASDATVTNYLSWAETIVRIQVNAQGSIDQLRKEIAAFPSEFLLFFPVAASLVLDDGKSSRRELKIERCGDELQLHDGENVSGWRVAKCDVLVDGDDARRDATKIHSRNSSPVAWAIPLHGRKEDAGCFWAFFPTTTPTRLPGILNAPWKVNSDRNSLIGGDWNRDLMRGAARLIAETLPKLATPEDPARPLDAFPRTLERQDELAAPLIDALWAALSSATVIPAADSVLRPAGELWRHPSDSMEVASQWRAIASAEDLARMVHPSCMAGRQRVSRLNALAERLRGSQEDSSSAPSLQRRTTEMWFSSVASTSISTALRVLQLAETFSNECKQGDWRSIRAKLAIIPSQAGTLLIPDETILAPPGSVVRDRVLVDLRLCDNTDAVRILTDVMGVKALDDGYWRSALRQSLEEAENSIRSTQETAWREFWSMLRAAPEGVRQGLFQYYRRRIRVRRVDGQWTPVDDVLLPGSLVGLNDGAGNRGVLVDQHTHSHDQAVLESLGVAEFPEGTIDCKGEYDLLENWLRTCRNLYKNTQPNAASRSYLEPTSLTMPKGWQFLSVLTGQPNTRLTESLMGRLVRGEFASDLRFGHSDKRYPEIDVAHPFPRFLMSNGFLLIGNKPVSLQAIVARRDQPAVERIIAQWQFASAVDRLQDSGYEYPTPAVSISALWHAMIETMVTPLALADDSLRDLWIGAAMDGIVPDSLRTHFGELDISEVCVTGSPDLARRARNFGLTVVTLENEALDLWLNCGARNLADLIHPEFASQSGPPELLVASFPELGEVLDEVASRTALSQLVVDLQLRLDESAIPIPCLLQDNVLLFDAVQLREASRANRLMTLLGEVSAAGWLRCDPNEAIKILGDAAVDERRAEVAAGRSLGDRLAIAVGRQPDPLRMALGKLGEAEFIQRITLEELADLTLAQLGPATLVALRATLEAEGLKPPIRWNTAESRAFVASIQFPPEFAASLQSRRDAEELVSGPIKLPPLHEFQIEVLEGIRELIDKGPGRRRGVVCLPTGGGKTRVTVEGVVKYVLRPAGSRRRVVWVAQTDELCEQAVQAFRQVWINIGAPKTDLRVIRLWGGHPNPASQEADSPVAVVSSIQTLNSRMSGGGLEWLGDPGIVVVDECHHAITPSYSNLLRWLDEGAKRARETDGDEPPIIGLSATPFRMDDSQSRRLAQRFDNRWFPEDQQQLHSRLRSQDVLAEACYEELQSNARLLPDELEKLSRLGDNWEGFALENILEGINQRLAGDAGRNEQLVARIQASEEQAILFFANSVGHAVEMSARLNLAGIPAAAISGDHRLTPAVARRYFLDRFQRGEIRVLCNHSVLTTGFDAPRTDMVLVARQVFSPVRFMQMVGRGLRGTANGGTDKCRIVTVIDNLGRFQDRHPYHYCQEYFRSMVD